MKKAKLPLLVILGPTATGKSDLAVKLAGWIAQEKIGNYSGAEIISADSRQVYKGLNIGTGKITSEEMHGIPHHLLDVADPHERFTAIQWKQLAEHAIIDIAARGKLPIICGGTGFYISTLIDDLGFPDVEADTEEQKKLEALSVDELFLELKKVDPNRSSAIDPKNKRRLARAIIIARALGAVPPIMRSVESKYHANMIGITLPDEKLKEKIHARLIQRLGIGMIEEAKRLHTPLLMGLELSYERMDELGLEYRYLSHYLQEKLNQEELIEKLATKIWQYAKRQMTWFKKDQRIVWFDPRKITEIQNLIIEKFGK
ncbi:MAG: tRNA (adenosine(37)-N6)-dimethylallyltransferase MiaA [Patescibacteria group bacterium]